MPLVTSPTASPSWSTGFPCLGIPSPSITNRTVHAMMHLGWVEEETGGYRGQMAVLVKPNGLFGEAYLAAIKPFRYLMVYPQLMRDIERVWRARRPAPTHARA